MKRLFPSNCTEEYKRHLQSQYWHEVQALKLKEAGYKCQLCGFIDSYDELSDLVVHHISGRYRFHEKEGLNSLMVLCCECHDRIEDFLHARDYLRAHRTDIVKTDLYDKALEYVGKHQAFANRYFETAKRQNGY